MNLKTENKEGKLIWKSISILIPTPILAAIFIPLFGFTHGYMLWDWVVFAAFMILTGVSITMGYHRLWSHKSFKANAIVRFILMFFGAAAIQNSILQWASDHRKHHRNVDHPEEDPYSASRGFWYSHFGWMLRYPKAHVEEISGVDDLKKDWIVRIQHKYYVPIAVLGSVVLPLAIGWTYGDMLGCFLLAGLLRVVLNHHFTFFINSLAHTFGKRKFSRNNSSRDNPLISLVTYGEGYHNFHHTFAGDYRNGIKWYDFDPSKWLIALGAKFGWCWDLKFTSKPNIELARAKVQLIEAQERIANRSQLDHLKDVFETYYSQLQTSIKNWAAANQDWITAKKSNIPRKQLIILKRQYRSLKREFVLSKHLWRQKLKYTQAFANV